VKAGKVRALGVTGNRTSAALPGVPTIAQAALPGFEFEGWMGVAVPPAAPAAIIGRLNAEQNRILGEKDTRARLAEAGLDIAGGSAEQMAAMMKDQAVRMVRLAKEAGIPPVD
jgi:tripartite-type tricarboxylate transporter receptor subunit TctC